MQQLHRRKICELTYWEQHPDDIQAQIEVLIKQRDAFEKYHSTRERLNVKIKTMSEELVQARAKELQTNYLLQFIPFANEEAEIQCQNAMKAKQVRGDPAQVFELSQELNRQMSDLTRRYKQQFWPHLAQNMDVGIGGMAEVLPIAWSDELSDRDGQYGMYGDDTPSPEPRRCTYRRINHFREYLRQQQGKSRVAISEEILAILRAELKKHHYAPEHCTPQIVRYLLKNLNLAATKMQSKSAKQRRQPGTSQFSWSLIYEHTPTLTILLNPSYRLIDIPTEKERLLCHLFEKTEAPFEKYKLSVKKGRKNFLSYPYMTYKLCELLGWDEFLPAFALLKSDDLLILQDNYFKLICKELNWQFVPTVGRIDVRETLSVQIVPKPDATT